MSRWQFQGKGKDFQICVSRRGEQHKRHDHNKGAQQNISPQKSGQKEEGNTKINALARRKAYEAKRKSELVVAANAKSKVNVILKKSEKEKIPLIKLKTNSTGKMVQQSTMNTEVNDMKNTSVQ